MKRLLRRIISPKSFMKMYAVGESCIVWSLGKTIDPLLSRQVLAGYLEVRSLRNQGKLAILDVVPSYNALAVYFDPLAVDRAEVRKTVETILAKALAGRLPKVRGRQATLPVVYDGADLDRVAERNHLPRERVIELYTRARYTVAMIGFLPHFPYLLGLPEQLATPRLESPRRRVHAGAVAIGGAQAGIYSRESPGGWNIVGTTDPKLLTPLEPGDTVIFRRS